MDFLRHLAFLLYKLIFRDNPYLGKAFGVKKIRKIPFGVCAGCMFFSSLKDGLWMTLGLYESDGQKWLKKHLHGRPDFVAIDAGTYIGFFSLAIANILQKSGGGVVYAFDPSSINIESLKKSMAENPSLRIVPLKLALGNQVGTVSGWVEKDVTMVRLNRDQKNSSNQSFEITTLDALLGSTIPRVDFIKVDVDGFEFELLQGARQVINRFHPRILVELHTLELALAVFDLMGTLNYKCLSLAGREVTRESLYHTKMAYDMWCEPIV